MSAYHRLGGLKNKHLRLTVPEAGKSKIKVPTYPVSGEGPPFGLQMTSFLLYPHMAKRKIISLMSFL